MQPETGFAQSTFRRRETSACWRCKSINKRLRNREWVLRSKLGRANHSCARGVWTTLCNRHPVANIYGEHVDKTAMVRKMVKYKVQWRMGKVHTKENIEAIKALLRK